MSIWQSQPHDNKGKYIIKNTQHYMVQIFCISYDISVMIEIRNDDHYK